MNIYEIKYALQNFRKRKLRSSLTILSIMIGITAIFALLSFGIGITNYVTKLADESGRNKLFIQGKGIGGPGTDETFFFTDGEAEAMIANAVACGNRVALPAGPQGEHERFQKWLISHGCEVSVFETSQSLPAGGTLVGCATQFIEYDR